MEGDLTVAAKVDTLKRTGVVEETATALLPDWTVEKV